MRSASILSTNTPQVIDGFDQAQPLQLQQRFAHRPLGHAELPRERLLAQALARLALQEAAGEDAALDFFPHFMPRDAGFHGLFRGHDGTFLPADQEARLRLERL